MLQLLLLELSKPHQSLPRIKQLHGIITRTHLLFHDPFYATKLLRFYSISNHLPSARYLFDQTPQRSVFLWNSIIRAYAKFHRLPQALSLYTNMLQTEIKPDNFTFACLFRACYESFDLDGLRVVHGGAVVSGFGDNPVCCSALVTGYSKLGNVGDATRVFDQIVDPDLVLVNAMISGYSYCGVWDKGVCLFDRVRKSGNQQPDGYTLVALISGLMDVRVLGLGQGVHTLSLKCGFDSNTYVGCALVSMYSRFKCMNSAFGVFRSLCQPDLVAWSSLITGYCQSGYYKEALLFYRNMNDGGKRADPILISSILVAAAQSADLVIGSSIHAYVLRHGFEANVMVCSVLIDMYLKCGILELGIRVFDSTPNRNVVSYNSVISGLGLHGYAAKAFVLFEEMSDKGLEPDESTFSALLSTCCHAGLVKNGQEYFKRMTDEFCISPRTEHYVHMVKLLGTAGELDEAYNFIMSLMQPVDSGVWGALLSCCDIHGNSELAEVASEQLFDKEPGKGVYRVMLSNIYAGKGRWDNANTTRDEIENAEVRKMPGISWIRGSYCQ
ncbi:Tetratricopeptide repeat (TPR)-like superfamily protein [Euphorbia peplus]|nr:Tetratricopeptide repeat (TPR)-like superfamily protein [Euphorbia peplus]